MPATASAAGPVQLPAFFLRNSNSAGSADSELSYGDPGDTPVRGDWDGNGTDTIGIYRNAQFFLRNSNSSGIADLAFPYGEPGDIPLVGDWDGNGTETIGVYRNGTFYLRNSNTPGNADLVFRYGDAGDIPLVGDWDGNGTDTVGVYRDGMFFLRNSNSPGNGDIATSFGDLGDLPIVGDWNGDGIDTVGVTRGPNFYLRNSNTPGVADLEFPYGDPGDIPLAGDWNGDHTDTIGVYRPPPVPFELHPYVGLGSWVDVFDWSYAHGSNPPAFTLNDVDRMADLGVQTLYLQPVHEEDPDDILEVDRVNAIITRAHLRGMKVVGWYLPEFVDVGNDLRHMNAMAQLPLDGIGVDIEATTVSDVNVRTQRLIAESDWFHATHPGQLLSAIVPSPTAMDVLAPSFWPGFPWVALTRDYQVWQPMAYFTYRTGDFRDAYTYFVDNINRVREHTAQPGGLVHPIGGIADLTSVDDVNGMARACSERGCIGSSLYDYLTTGDDLWGPLQQFRR
jgi:hypothetical protein